MSGSQVEKLSISLPRDLAKAVRKRVGSRGVSSYTARALEAALERERLGAYLKELDDEFGPVPEALLEEARRAWAKR